LLTRLDHPRIQRWVRLRTDRKERAADQAVLLTSPKEIEEVTSVAQIKTLIVTPDFVIPPFWKAEEQVLVSESLLQKITGLSAPQGCAAEVAIPAEVQDLGDWVLVLDGVQDPGNCGTILRTALALGWSGVWVLPGTVDLWNEKAIRSAKGAMFKLPFRQGSEQELVSWQKQRGAAMLVADLQGTPCRTWSAPCILVLGNEARGPRSSWSGAERVTVPQAGEMESLNVAVAGGILMAALRGVI
jgi:TrmH family RNA methyltransferase